MEHDAVNEQGSAQRQSPSPLRILQVTARYFPYLGGIETHVFEVSRRMAAGGVDVTVLTTDPRNNLPSTEVADGVRIIRVPAYPRRKDYYYAPEISHVLRRATWDVVHVQGCHTFVAPLAMLAARRAHIPYVLTFHTGGHSSGWRNSIRGVQWRVQRPLYRRARRLIGVSQFEAEYFQRVLRLPVSQFSVVQNGGNLPAIDQDTEEGAEEFPHIVSIGRLERYKGHHRAIAAMPYLLQRYPRATLRIIGAGPYESVLRGLAQQQGLEKCVSIGAIPPEDRGGMARALMRAHVVMLLSDYEAHPIAVMEAVALGRPVLVTATSGLKEMADNQLATAIPLKSSPSDIAAAIAQQLDRPHIPPPVNLPTWADCTKHLLDVYAQVLSETHRESARVF